MDYPKNWKSFLPIEARNVESVGGEEIIIFGYLGISYEEAFLCYIFRSIILIGLNIMLHYFRQKRQDKHQMGITLHHDNFRILLRNFLFDFLQQRAGIRIVNFSYSHYWPVTQFKKHKNMTYQLNQSSNFGKRKYEVRILRRQWTYHFQIFFHHKSCTSIPYQRGIPK